MLRLPLRLCLLGIVLTLSACANNGESGGGKVPQPPTSLPGFSADTPQPVLIWHFLDGVDRDTLEQIQGQFKTAHPEIDVQVEFHDASTLLADYETAVNTGTGPDLLFGRPEWIPTLAQAGLIQPISMDLFNQLSTTISETLAYSTRYQDVPYGVVYTIDFVTLYYNRTLVPVSPGSYEDLLTVAANQGLIIPPTFSATSGLYLSPGRRLIDEQGASLITTFGFETYLNEVHTLAGQPGVVFTFDQTGFTTGQVGLIFASSRDYASLHQALGDNLGVLQFPQLPSSDWSTLLTIHPILFSLNSTQEAAEAAGVFIQYLDSAEIQRLWFDGTGRAPINPAQLEQSDLRAAWREAVEWGTPAPLPETFSTKIRPALDQAIQAVAASGADPAETAATTLQTIQN